MNTSYAKILIGVLTLSMLAPLVAADASGSDLQVCSTQEEEENGTDTCGLNVLSPTYVALLRNGGTASLTGTSQNTVSDTEFVPSDARTYRPKILFPAAAGHQNNDAYYSVWWGWAAYASFDCRALTPPVTSAQLDCTSSLGSASVDRNHKLDTDRKFGACAAFCSWDSRIEFYR